MLPLLDFEQAGRHEVVESVVVPGGADNAEYGCDDARQSTDIRKHIKDSKHIALVMHHVQVHLDRNGDPGVVKAFIW